MTQTETLTGTDQFVSLTLHNFSAEMLKDFAQKIVKPHFRGNLNQALRALMENAINEETTFNNTLIVESEKAKSEI